MSSFRRYDYSLLSCNSFSYIMTYSQDLFLTLLHRVIIYSTCFREFCVDMLVPWSIFYYNYKYDVLLFINFVLLYICSSMYICVFVHFVIVSMYNMCLCYIHCSLFVCNELSSETWVLGAHKTCLKVLQALHFLAST